MLSSALSIRPLLVAIFVLMTGSGFLSTLIAIRLEQAGTPALLIGLVGTSYFAGLTWGAFRVEALIARVGHIRAFAAFVTVFSASSLTYAVIDYPYLWIVLRVIDGFAMAGVFVCLESWLNQQASARTRSTVLAAYMIALYSGQAAGQFLSLPQYPDVTFQVLYHPAFILRDPRKKQPMWEHIQLLKERIHAGAG